MKHCSSIKKNKLMPFAAIWMQLQIIIESEVNHERQILYDITYIWNLKYSTKEPRYKTEMDL